MKKEQIENFNYRAFIKLVQDNPEWADKIREKGFDVYSQFFIGFHLTASGLNGKFKKELLALYRQEFEEKVNKDAEAQFERFCQMYPILKEQRHFIIVGDNNFWCTNCSIDKDKNIENELQKEIESLKESIDSKNLPDEFIVYETEFKQPILKIN